MKTSIALFNEMCGWAERLSLNSVYWQIAKSRIAMETIASSEEARLCFTLLTFVSFTFLSSLLFCAQPFSPSLFPSFSFIYFYFRKEKKKKKILFYFFVSNFSFTVSHDNDYKIITGMIMLFFFSSIFF